MSNQQEKTAFVAALAKEPCKAGRLAFLAFPGSIQEYFNAHPRGVSDFLWCVGHGGLMKTSWAYIATPGRIDACAEAKPHVALVYAPKSLTAERLDACAKAFPTYALEFAAAHLTPERLAWCKAELATK